MDCASPVSVRGAPRKFETPLGIFELVPERDEDDAFLKDLFAANNTQILRGAGMPDALVERMLDFQYRSQTQTYKTLFANAQFSIVRFGGESVGRFIENDEGDIVYFVDFALLPERQASGLGYALCSAMMRACAARGKDVRAKVVVSNDPCLRLCKRLGFVQGEVDEAAHVSLVWRCPVSVQANSL